MRKHLLKNALSILSLSLISSHASAITNISIQVGEMQGENLHARNVKLDYKLDSQFSVKGQLPSADGKWSEASLACKSLTISNSRKVHCDHGKVVSERAKGDFTLLLKSTPTLLAADVALRDFSFSDVTGLHAGEKVSGKLNLDADKTKEGWRWQTALDWTEGEVFWQPFYFSHGGHQLNASGLLNPELVRVDQAVVKLKQIGDLRFNGTYLRTTKKLDTLTADASDLDLATLYPLMLKPLLEKTALNKLEMAGRADFSVDIQQGEPRAFRLDLKDADIDDDEGKFGLYKLNASIPWDYDEPKQVRLAYAGGHLLKLPLGQADLVAEVNRYAVTAPSLRIPVLDGALQLNDVSAAWVGDQWHWHLRAALEPVTLSEFSHALGWPRLEGKASASIPLVTYTGGKLSTDGALGFNLFNGSLAVTNLSMQDPMGPAPRLNADLQFRKLDLGDLTRTFSFGAIEGKLDGDVNNLELVKWQPTSFDARFISSPGRYPKKISQRAVENISSLGGAGAAAAIQRSVLRFFEQFNYDKIGLSCRLRNDICQMSGVQSTPEGYIIVKGSGVPAITVMGYNHNVSWGELLSRIQRITAGNAKPVIK
jgi:hypothetical protein